MQLPSPSGLPHPQAIFLCATLSLSLSLSLFPSPCLQVFFFRHLQLSISPCSLHVPVPSLAFANLPAFPLGDRALLQPPILLKLLCFHRRLSIYPAGTAHPLNSWTRLGSHYVLEFLSGSMSDAFTVRPNDGPEVLVDANATDANLTYLELWSYCQLDFFLERALQDVHSGTTSTQPKGNQSCPTWSIANPLKNPRF